MARIVMIGGGMVGSCAAMMLAADGNEVVVLERDPAPATSPDEAWDTWERRGVNQFRLPHLLLARFRQEIDAELPGLSDALLAGGALRDDIVAGIPDDFTGGRRPDDDRFVAITARRPVAEAVVAACTAATAGVTVRRGVAVRALVTEPGRDGVVHVRGVVTDDGEEIGGDLVVDCSGRRTAVPEMLRRAGSPGPDETIDDCGFVYYGRHFRSADGSLPFTLGSPLQHHPTLSTLTLKADHGTWGVVVVASAADTALRALRDADTFHRFVGAFPLVAHWLDGEPIDDVRSITGLEDRVRRYVVDGRPVATGIVALGDAWACTNPSLGRGVSLGAVHATALRALVADGGLDDGWDVALRWDALTTERVWPLLAETFRIDGHRLAEVDAAIDGRGYETDDPFWADYGAMGAASISSPDLLRASLEVGMLLRRAEDVLADGDLRARAHAGANPTPIPGPDPAGVLALLGA